MSPPGSPSRPPARPLWFVGLGHWAPNFRALCFSFFPFFFFPPWLLLFVPASVFWFLNRFWTGLVS